ncbi:MAG TPA: hypothetical protein GXX36_13075 [Clostridiaceae bacterium]|nr:hypothetical protein [Clostridiaceae bacterium]
MRTKRVEKFKRYRRKKIRNYFLFIFVLPSLVLAIGYLISSLIILPVMNG